MTTTSVTAVAAIIAAHSAVQASQAAPPDNGIWFGLSLVTFLIATLYFTFR
jgi:hypothetical protein